jgi:hypothetical protein
VTDYLKSENKHWVDLIGSDVPKSELALPERVQPPDVPAWDESLANAKRELQDLVGRLGQFEQQSAPAAQPGSVESAPLAAEPAAAVLPPADYVLPMLNAEKEKRGAVEEAGAKGQGSSVLGPLGTLFSTFGERSRASESPKRIV